jgi:rare lipoprotein A
MKRATILLICGLVISAFAAAQANNFRQEGEASWYGEQFRNKPTASGELFSPEALTAAHLTLPFGALITVTNKSNGKQVTVRINDRGPYVKGRIIDLSEKAFKQIALAGEGVVQVSIETAKTALSAEEGEDAAPAPALVRPTMPPLGTGKTYRIQVGAYKVPRYAVDAFEKLKEQDLDPAYEKSGDFFRVVLAGLPPEEIESVAEKLGKAGCQEVLIREEW